MKNNFLLPVVKGPMKYMQKLWQIIKKEFLPVAAGTAAAVSAVFVPPSLEYVSYIDFKVIAILFSLMVVIAGIRETGAFEVLAQKMLLKTGSVRTMSLALILLCFFSSMLITNDVALLTFVPFTIAVLSFAGKGNLIFVITMQTVAANLGSMLTPVGNPQNLYLYSFFHLSIKDFLLITLPIVAFSLLIIVGITFVIKNSLVSVNFAKKTDIENRRKLYIFLAMFALCIAAVVGLISYIPMLLAVCLVVMFTDRQTFKKVDYSLMLTFVFFFVFVGNISQLESTQEAIGSIIHGREILFAVLLSQIISNVPAAVMLSSFTDNYPMLIAGTNIGGLGTLVASLASLISFKLYLKTEHAKPVKYLIVFTLVNLLILPTLLTFTFLWY